MNIFIHVRIQAMCIVHRRNSKTHKLACTRWWLYQSSCHSQLQTLAKWNRMRLELVVNCHHQWKINIFCRWMHARVLCCILMWFSWIIKKRTNEKDDTCYSLTTTGIDIIHKLSIQSKRKKTNISMTKTKHKKLMPGIARHVIHFYCPNKNVFIVVILVNLFVFTWL